ncbi:hypothetical protein EJV47_12510 [Hymenobacter gummosus]|uniref:DUF4352 domain-containing protein n=1 Tax=Hymenobacter gummosus TaxID=1776032 RepID=A0A431U2U1_9BACT|nr:hypothetical protein [Hymenobacter gummosus]RTQ49633.1 hypothetical protein EJV47_12510 [Hymenobacter gummosus]
MHKSLILAGVLALSLAACSQEKTADSPESTTTETTTTTTQPAPPAPAPADAGVARTEAAAPAPAPAPAALATQPGPRGSQVALTKARVVGDILSVELQYMLPPSSDVSGSVSVFEDIDQVNYVDDATSRKYEVLKDQQGKFMASPLSFNNKQFRVDVRKNLPALVSLKFPAPPATSQTISLRIPEAGSFDAVAVQR